MYARINPACAMLVFAAVPCVFQTCPRHNTEMERKKERITGKRTRSSRQQANYGWQYRFHRHFEMLEPDSRAIQYAYNTHTHTHTHTYIYIHIYIYIYIALRPKAGYSLLIHEVTRSHND
jgi:hypothetical protein